MLADELRTESFEEFATRVEPRLRAGLSASFGSQAGREAAVDALVYAWQNWDRVRPMDNPTGYLYAVGRSHARRRLSRRRVVLPLPDESRTPWVEPGLPAALSSLTEQQRTAVALHHGYEWTLAEIAQLLGISKSSVQNHLRRGLKKLRRRLGATGE